MTNDDKVEAVPEPDFLVVINHEQQYSVWPANREVPAGWKSAGYSGSREQCLDHIEQVWVDMRPLSIRRSATSDPVHDRN